MIRTEDQAKERLFLALAGAVVLGFLLWTAQRALGGPILFLSAWILSRALPAGPARGALRTILGLFLLLWILHEARWVVYPLVAGTLAAYVASPAVAWLERRRLRRSLAAGLALLPIALLTALALLLIVPALVNQMQLLVEKLPGMYAHLSEWLRNIDQHLVPGSAPSVTALPPALSGPPDSVMAALPSPDVSPLPSIAGQLVGQAESLVRAALGSLTGLGKGLGRALQWLSLLLLTPVVTYHLLVDWENLRDTTLRWLPERWHTWTRRLAGELKNSMQVYMRGQLLVAGVEAVLFSAAFALAGLPQPLALGILAGLFSLVPILGFWLTVLIVVLNAVTGPAPWATLLKAGAGLLVINVLEGQVLVPKIQGTGLGLHPLVVLLGVLLFGTLFGFAGVILAVPILGVLRTVLPELLSAWQSSGPFQSGSGDQTGSPD